MLKYFKNIKYISIFVVLRVKAKYCGMSFKLKTIYIILLVALCLTSCKDPNSFTISGEIKGLTESEIFFVSQNHSAIQIDTVLTQKGKFSFKGISESLTPVVIYMETGNVWITVWAKNGEKLSVKGNAKYPELIISKGNSVNDLLSKFKENNQNGIRERGDLRDKEMLNKDLNGSLDISDASISSQIKNLDMMLKNQAEDFVKLHSSSLASLVLIQDYILDMDDAKTIQYYLDLLQGEARDNELFQKIEELIVREIVTAEGNPAPEFELITTTNDTITLDTYKDKYLLLSFLASWCETCEPAYASLTEIRKNFSPKDLEIVTISLDENSSDWKNLAKEKDITWKQVIDNKGWSAEVAEAYKVNEIPTYLLIDKKGTIIGSGVPIDIINERLNLLIEINN